LEAALMYDRRVAATLGEDDSMNEGQLWTDIKNGKQFVYPRLLFIITGIIHSTINLNNKSLCIV
jgi:beta-1,4-mannosyltransferase